MDHTGNIVLAVGAGLLALVLGGVVLVVWRRRKPEQTQVDLQMPEELNAFSVLGLLKRIEHNNGFSQERQVEWGRRMGPFA